jgi:hypothetical protein
MDYKADRDHGHHMDCKVCASCACLRCQVARELNCHRTLLTRVMRAFNQAKSTSTSLAGHSGRARLEGMDSRVHLPLLCEVPEDVLLKRIVVGLPQAKKLHLHATCKTMRTLLESAQAWTHVDMSFDVVGVRTSRSGRRSLLTATPLFFACQVQVASCCACAKTPLKPLVLLPLV